MKKTFTILMAVASLTIVSTRSAQTTYGEWAYDFEWDYGIGYNLIDGDPCDGYASWMNRCSRMLVLINPEPARSTYWSPDFIQMLTFSHWNTVYMKMRRKDKNSAYVDYLQETAGPEFGVMGPYSLLAPMYKNILPGEDLGQYNERMGIKPEKKYKVIGPPAPPDSPLAGSVPIEEVEEAP
jgi:hypothetical protein